MIRNIAAVRRLCRLAVILFLPSAVLGAAAPGSLQLTLLHLNDVYQIGPVDKGQRGGLARVAGLYRQVLAENPNTLLLFGGDTLSPSVASNLFQGRQMIAAWNAAGLDLAVPGNHEFDFGPEVMQRRIGESEFRWIASNLVQTGDRQPLPGTSRSLIRRFGGIAVGFIGLITPGTAQTSKPGPALRFLDPVPVARELAADLRARGATVVVALTHMSLAEDKALARTGIVDLILGGHDHAPHQLLVGGTPIFKAGSDARDLVRIDLGFDVRDRRLDTLSWQTLPVDRQTPEAADVLAVAARYEDLMSEALDQPVCTTGVALNARQTANRSRETNLGSLIADLFRHRTGADVAIVNGGAIRSDTTYGPGVLTRRDIMSVVPFEDPIIKVALSGRVLRQALEHGLARVAEDREDGRFPQVSGLRYRYDPNRPPGGRLLEVTVGGRPLDEARRYTLAGSSYLLNGGDGYTMLRDLERLTAAEDGAIASNIVMDGLSGKHIAPMTDGRIAAVAANR